MTVRAVSARGRRISAGSAAGARPLVAWLRSCPVTVLLGAAVLVWLAGAWLAGVAGSTHAVSAAPVLVADGTPDDQSSPAPKSAAPSQPSSSPSENSGSAKPPQSSPANKPASGQQSGSGQSEAQPASAPGPKPETRPAGAEASTDGAGVVHRAGMNTPPEGSPAGQADAGPRSARPGETPTGGSTGKSGNPGSPGCEGCSPLPPAPGTPAPNGGGPSGAGAGNGAGGTGAGKDQPGTDNAGRFTSHMSPQQRPSAQPAGDTARNPQDPNAIRGPPAKKAPQPTAQPEQAAPKVKPVSDSRPDDNDSGHLKPLPKDPKELNNYWRTLRPEQKKAYFELDRTLGNRDGIPQKDRDEFNSTNLKEDSDQANKRFDDLKQRHPDWAEGKNLPKEQEPGQMGGEGINPMWTAWNNWKEAYKNATEQKDRYDKLKGLLERTPDGKPNPGKPPRLLSSYDKEGDGHAAIAITDPDKADNVTTYVPGTGANLDEMSRGVDRAETMQSDATQIDPAHKTSVIAWYGYDAPPKVFPHAGKKSYAVDGAGTLNDFQSGLRATHEGPRSNNTVLGHSYGTRTIGEAASGGRSLDADQLAFVASPGTGVNNVSELSMTGHDRSENGQRVFATRNDADPIKLISWTSFHGREPIKPEYGATVFEASHAPGNVFGWVETNGDVGGGHGSYWNRENPARRGMANIIVGRPPSS